MKYNHNNIVRNWLKYVLKNIIVWQQHYSNNWLIKSGPSEKAMVGRLVYCFCHQHGCITKKQWSEPANSFRHGWFQESPATMTINKHTEESRSQHKCGQDRVNKRNTDKSVIIDRMFSRDREGWFKPKRGGMREVREGVQSCLVYILVWTIPPWPYQNDLCRQERGHHIITYLGN